jgi:hypothetical protein
VYYQASEGESYLVCVTKDEAFLGKGCMARIYIDGQPAADLLSAETVTFKLPPGRHILGGGPSPKAACSAFKADERLRREVDASGQAGESLGFRYLATSRGEFVLTPTAF